MSELQSLIQKAARLQRRWQMLMAMAVDVGEALDELIREVAALQRRSQESVVQDERQVESSRGTSQAAE